MVSPIAEYARLSERGKEGYQRYETRIRAMFLLQYLTCQEEKEYRET